jgi:hypothetical protein
LAWRERYERHRFDVPGLQVAPFDPRDSVATAALIAQGRLMALPIALDASPPTGHAVYAERLDLRIGVPFAEVLEVVLRRRFDLIVQRLVIIEGRTRPARSGLSGSEDLVDREAEVGESQRAHELAPAESPDRPVAGAGRARVDLDHVVLDIHNPVLQDSRSRVQGELDLPVATERSARDLDEQHDVPRLRSRVAIRHWARAEEGDVGLRLGTFRQADRSLGPDYGSRTDTDDEDTHQGRDTGSMREADRCHLDDLTVEELHPVPRREDADLGHVQVLVHGESPANYVHGHRAPP